MVITTQCSAMLKKLSSEFLLLSKLPDKQNNGLFSIVAYFFTFCILKRHVLVYANDPRKREAKLLITEYKFWGNI